MIPTGRRALLGDLRSVLLPWITARLLVAAAYGLARLLEGGSGSRTSRGLIAWDGDWYISILTHGYDGVTREGARFFPGYVLVGRLFDVVLPGGPVTALLLVANVASLVATVLVFRLALAETADRATALRAAWALSLFPSAFVLVWAYGEGLFLALALGVLLAARRERWWWCAVMGLAAGLVRPTGALLALAVAAAACRPTSVAPQRVVARVAAVAGGPVGTLAFVWWVSSRFDEAFLPLTVQRELRGDPRNPLARLLEGLADLGRSTTWTDGLHAVAAGVVLVVLVALFRTWPVRYGVLAGACLLVALAADNLNSLERYVFNGVPVVLGVATLAGYRRFGQLVPVVSGAAMVVLATAAWTGSYVP